MFPPIPGYQKRQLRELRAAYAAMRRRLYATLTSLDETWMTGSKAVDEAAPDAKQGALDRLTASMVPFATQLRLPERQADSDVSNPVLSSFKQFL
jgi:hypothetical protein